MHKGGRNREAGPERQEERKKNCAILENKKVESTWKSVYDLDIMSKSVEGMLVCRTVNHSLKTRMQQISLEVLLPEYLGGKE